MNTDRSKKIFLTGGTGFLGSYILQHLLERGYFVRALRRGKKIPFALPSELLEKVEWIEGDVLDVVSLQDGLDGIDLVIHCAAIVSFIKKDRKEMYRVNVDGTANVVNMALEKNVSRIIHISSVAALGRLPGGGSVDEEKKWEENKINTHYAISKHKAELEVWRGFCEGLNGVILNPSTILGYGNWHEGSCAIFKSVYDGFNWYSPGINGFVDVADVVRACLLFVENDITEERFIVNGNNWPFRKLQDSIADGFRKKHPSWKTNHFLLAIAWRLEKFKSLFSRKRPLLTRESARVAESKTYFLNNRFRETFPEFSFTPLELTIQKACENYLKRQDSVQP